MITKNFPLKNIEKHYIMILIDVKKNKEKNGKLNIYNNQE